MYHGSSDEERKSNKRGTVSHRGPTSPEQFNAGIYSGT